MVGQILDFLIAIPKIAALVSSIVTQIVSWYVSKQTKDTLVDIADAAATGANAETDEDRYAASEKWQKVFGHSRYLP